MGIFPHRAFIASDAGRILVGVDQASVPQLGHHSDTTAFGDGKTTLATSDHTGATGHFGVHIPCGMNNDRPRPDVAVHAIKTLKPHRWAMCALISVGGNIGTLR